MILIKPASLMEYFLKLIIYTINTSFPHASIKLLFHVTLKISFVNIVCNSSKMPCTQWPCITETGESSIYSEKLNAVLILVPRVSYSHLMFRKLLIKCKKIKDCCHTAPETLPPQYFITSIYHRNGIQIMIRKIKHFFKCSEFPQENVNKYFTFLRMEQQGISICAVCCSMF